MHVAHPNRAARQFSGLRDDLYSRRSSQQKGLISVISALILVPCFLLGENNNKLVSPRRFEETFNSALSFFGVGEDALPDITHNNSYVRMTDSSFQTHPVTEMPLLVCTIHNEPQSCDWCLFPLISFICSSRLGGAVFQGQWITHPRQGEDTHIYYGFRDTDRKFWNVLDRGRGTVRGLLDWIETDLVPHCAVPALNIIRSAEQPRCYPKYVWWLVCKISSDNN